MGSSSYPQLSRGRANHAAHSITRTFETRRRARHRQGGILTTKNHALYASLEKDVSRTRPRFVEIEWPFAGRRDEDEEGNQSNDYEQLETIWSIICLDVVPLALPGAMMTEKSWPVIARMAPRSQSMGRTSVSRATTPTTPTASTAASISPKVHKTGGPGMDILDGERPISW